MTAAEYRAVLDRDAGRDSTLMRCEGPCGLGVRPRHAVRVDGPGGRTAHMCPICAEAAKGEAG